MCDIHNPHGACSTDYDLYFSLKPLSSSWIHIKHLFKVQNYSIKKILLCEQAKTWTKSQFPLAAFEFFLSFCFLPFVFMSQKTNYYLLHSNLGQPKTNLKFGSNQLLICSLWLKKCILSRRNKTKGLKWNEVTFQCCNSSTNHTILFKFST